MSEKIHHFIEPDRKPDFILCTRDETSCLFWIDIITPVETILSYRYENGFWVGGFVSKCRIRPDRVDFTHDDGHFGRWCDDEGNGDENVSSSRIRDALCEFQSKLDEIILDN